MLAWLRWTLLLGGGSFVVMALIDRGLGARAEFLNACSVIERLLGRAPAAGVSQIAERLGPTGEAVVVVLANLAIGGLLALLLRRLWS